MLTTILLTMMTKILKYRNHFDHVALGPNNLNMKSATEVLIAASARAPREAAIQVSLIIALIF